MPLLQLEITPYASTHCCLALIFLTWFELSKDYDLKDKKYVEPCLLGGQITIERGNKEWHWQAIIFAHFKGGLVTRTYSMKSLDLGPP